LIQLLNEALRTLNLTAEVRSALGAIRDKHSEAEGQRSKVKVTGQGHKVNLLLAVRVCVRA